MRLLYRLRFSRDHGWAPDHMSEYLDGELAPGGRSRMERHARDCPECARLLAGLRAVVQGLARLPAPAGADATRITALVRGRLDEPPPS
ncbi:MAG TPA: zf-HC2 domain-containing protein [Solirubrobacteraceae bacterium]|jgi:anti-sigma factor RsiW|nr:zf-HC2 domain-containing protein [Solirubrobacteraceae bacterium]